MRSVLSGGHRLHSDPGGGGKSLQTVRLLFLLSLARGDRRYTSPHSDRYSAHPGLLLSSHQTDADNLNSLSKFNGVCLQFNILDFLRERTISQPTSGSSDINTTDYLPWLTTAYELPVNLLEDSGGSIQAGDSVNISDPDFLSDIEKIMKPILHTFLKM